MYWSVVVIVYALAQETVGYLDGSDEDFDDSIDEEEFTTPHPAPPRDSPRKRRYNEQTDHLLQTYYDASDADIFPVRLPMYPKTVPMLFRTGNLKIPTPTITLTTPENQPASTLQTIPLKPMRSSLSTNHATRTHTTTLSPEYRRTNVTAHRPIDTLTQPSDAIQREAETTPTDTIIIETEPIPLKPQRSSVSTIHATRTHQTTVSPENRPIDANTETIQADTVMFGTETILLTTDTMTDIPTNKDIPTHSVMNQKATTQSYTYENKLGIESVRLRLPELSKPVENLLTKKTSPLRMQKLAEIRNTSAMSASPAEVPRAFIDEDELLRQLNQMTTLDLVEQFNNIFENFTVTSQPIETEETMTTLGFTNASLISKCFVCGLNDTGIPYNSRCADAFSGDFIPLVPVDTQARGHIFSFRKYCRYLNVPGVIQSIFEPSSVFGRFTGGCSVRWADLTPVYTQRTCRNRRRPVTGRHFASKRMAKLELALRDIENGCLISPMATLLPVSRGISVYARFHACVCTGEWCNRAVPMRQWIINIQIVFSYLVLLVMG